MNDNYEMAMDHLKDEADKMPDPYNHDACLKSYRAIESERDALKREVEQMKKLDPSDLKLVNEFQAFRELRAKCEAKDAEIARLRQTLETISKDVVRIEYRGADFAHYESSEMANLAKSALSDKKGAV